MILLPRGNPVKENINPGKVNMADALGKLRQGKFTGYLRFDFPSGTGVFIFQTGCLISTLFQSGVIQNYILKVGFAVGVILLFHNFIIRIFW